MDEVFEVIKHNIVRILSVYNVNNTAALKNYASCLDYEEAKKLFKNEFNNVLFLSSG